MRGCSVGNDTIKQRLIKNEQLIRARNTETSKGIKTFFRNKKEVVSAPVAFVCECSDLDCKEHVHTSIESYEKLHKRKDRFTIYPGHETPSVEKVVDQHEDFDIVQKVDLKP